eukprot:5040717-Lingulodinium_polyedra.AAC.1
MPESRRFCRKVAWYPSMSNPGSSGPAPRDVRVGMELSLRADAKCCWMRRASVSKHACLPSAISR